jgi:hypothetical protein
MVRHYFVPGPISAAAGCMSEAAVPARLITPGDIPTARGTGNMSAASGAINLPTVTTSADQYLRPTTFAEKEASGIMFIRPSAAAMTWTRGLVCAIITRHSCTARCRARRRVDLHVRSALCLPSSIDAKITARAAAAPSLTPSPESCLGYFPTGPPPMLACAQASIGGGAVLSAEQQAKSLPKNLCGPLGSE